MTAENCILKMDMMISHDEKLKKLKENPELYHDYTEKFRLIAENAELTAEARKNESRALLEEAFLKGHHRMAIKADDAFKVTKLVTEWMGGLGKKYKDPKEAILSRFNRVAGKVDTVENQIKAYKGRLNNGLIDNLQNSNVFDFAQRGTYDMEVADVVASGRKHVGEGAEIINTIAAIHEANGSSFVEVLNSAGAFIKKRTGHLISQFHNGALMYKAGFDNWAAFIEPRLDKDLTFADSTPEQIKERLKEIFTNSVETITDIDHISAESFITASVNTAGAGVASAERARKLTFKSGSASFEYHQEFGRQGTLLAATMARNRAGARAAAMIENFGHKPKENLQKAIDSFLKYSGARLSAGEKINIETNAMQALDIVSGRSTMTASAKMAAGGAAIRNVSSLAMLGKAVFASIAFDPTAIAIQRAQNTGRSLLFTLPEAYINNIATLINPMSKAEKVSFGNKMGIAIDMLDETYADMMHLDGDIDPGGTRTALNAMYRYTGADYANNSARVTGVKSSIEDLKDITQRLDSPAAIKMKERYGFTDEDFKHMQEMGYDAPKMDNDVYKKFATYTNAAYAAASPSLDDRFRREFLQGTLGGTNTGEILRFLGHFKTASYRQMYDINELMRVNAPNYGVGEGVGILKYAIPELAAFAVYATGAGLLRAYSNHLISGKEEPFDVLSARNIKYAIQSSGSLGGMISDLAVPGVSYLVGNESKAALYQHIVDFAAPSASYGFNAAGTVKDMSLNLFDGDGFFKSEKEARKFYRLLPGNNIWYLEGVKNYLNDATLIH